MSVSERTRRGILFVVSGPSGAGKTTLVRRLLAEERGLEFSVSFTTRPRRPGEVDGKDYHFVDEGAFDRMVAEGAFLEWASVHGRRYGTGRQAVVDVLERGGDLLLDVDVQGAGQIREHSELGRDAVFVLVMPPSFETLRNRLRARGSEDDREVERRLAVWAKEARAAIEAAIRTDRSGYLILNEELGEATRNLASVVSAERCRTHRQIDRAQAILSGRN